MRRLLLATLLTILPGLGGALSLHPDLPSLPDDPCNTLGEHQAYILCLAPDLEPPIPDPFVPIIDLSCDTPGLPGCPDLPPGPVVVVDDDPAVVPLPPAFGLLAGALAVLGATRRGRSNGRSC